MSIFWYALLGHLLFEFYWSPDRPIEQGHRNFLDMMIHVCTWTLIISCILGVVESIHPGEVAFLFLTHWWIDVTKQYVKAPRWWWLTVLVDQLLHLITIFAVWKWW